MSLLDNGPDEVTVYTDSVTTADEYGNEIVGPSPTGVAVRGRWQPATAEETADLGQQTTTIYRFLTRDFPGGPYARVTFDGSDWEVVAQPRKHRGSTATSHSTVYLKER